MRRSNRVSSAGAKNSGGITSCIFTTKDIVYSLNTMNSKKWILSILALSVYGLFIAATPTFAILVRSGDSVSISKNETISESVFLTGQVINVDGTVEGDVICGGQDIEITGTVNGDIICAGQTISISGTVKGNIRTVGQSVRLNGMVDRNISLIGQNITTSSGSAVMGEAILGGQNIQLDGSIAKKLSGGVETARINGMVSEIDLHTESLTLGSTAVVEKNLTYTSNANAKIENQESVQGEIVKKTPPPEERKRSESAEKAWNSYWKGAKIASLISQILLAFILLYFFSGRMLLASALMKERVWPSFGLGALILFLFPFVFLLFVLTLVGIPLAMLLLLLFIFACFLSKALAALAVGKLLLGQFWAAKQDNKYWSAAIGLIALWLLYSTPFIGGLISFLSLLWGLGGVYYMLKPRELEVKIKKSAK